MERGVGVALGLQVAPQGGGLRGRRPEVRRARGQDLVSGLAREQVKVGLGARDPRRLVHQRVKAVDLVQIAHKAQAGSGCAAIVMGGLAQIDDLDVGKHRPQRHHIVERSGHLRVFYGQRVGLEPCRIRRGVGERTGQRTHG